jgi:hypothetical protein
MKRTKEDESSVVSRVSVRLVEEHERSEFDRLLIERHYLESARLSGQTLRYVAELDGAWVALVCFGAAALHLKAREKHLGWSPRQRARRLKFVVSNSRFLVLSERQRYPNLGSRVLALCLRRLNADWQERWKHPVLAVESFVDESLHPGTCYRACGFQALGLTQGYGRASRDFYTEHGQPKQLYLRALQPDAAAILRRGRLPGVWAEHEEVLAGPCPFRAGPLRGLRERFLTLADPRKRGHGMRHRQAPVLACAATALLLGAGGYAAFEDVCGKFTQRQLAALGCWQDERGRFHPPSDSTFFRVLSRLDADHFEHLIAGWLIEQEPSELARLAVDGKVLRGSGRADGKPLQLLSAVTHRLRLTLASIPIAEKSNEIPALQPLLRGRALEGTLITADAMHCQQESARFVTQELGGDYLFGLKGNQSGVLERAEGKLSPLFFSL